MKKIAVLHRDTHMQYTARCSEENKVARLYLLPADSITRLKLFAGISRKRGIKIISEYSLCERRAINPGAAIPTQSVRCALPLGVGTMKLPLYFCKCPSLRRNRHRCRWRRTRIGVLPFTYHATRCGEHQKNR